MSMFAALLMLQAAPVIGTVPVPNKELDVAQACLAKGTQEIFRMFDWKPETDERWRWAMKVVDGCDAEIRRAANSKEAIHMPNDVGHGGGVSKHAALRSEAAYYVDRLIRDHFEKTL
ncbi:MAG: hypothetical protein AAFO28_06050 [Pseudomonadota bacterium]